MSWKMRKPCSAVWPAALKRKILTPKGTATGSRAIRWRWRKACASRTSSAWRCAAVVHDIGKVAVPEHILLKPGPLDLEERLIMETHPAVGARICSPLKSFRLVLPIIRHHHERLDGSGYPDGLAHGAIPL